MRSTLKRSIILFACVAIATITFTFGAAAMAAENRPTISDGARALAAREVQNVMSKHEYYHAAGFNLQEVKDLWVSEDGPNAKTAAFFSPSWVMQGVATIKKNYGEGHESDKKAVFEQLKKIYPELESVDVETGDVGGEFAMHTSTTPVIEVAGDGKTAKGIWYSPGLGLTPHVSGESVQVGSIFFWEKYAADFIKENGKWKIWHLGMYYDFTASLPESMTANLGKGTATPEVEGGRGGAPGGGGPGGGGPGGPQQAQQDNREKGERMTAEEIAKGGMLDNPYKYPNWSPDRKNLITPLFPEPYYTFSETFSYGPYDDNNQYNERFNKDYNKAYYDAVKK